MVRVVRALATHLGIQGSVATAALIPLVSPCVRVRVRVRVGVKVRVRVRVRHEAHIRRGQPQRCEIGQVTQQRHGGLVRVSWG